MSTIRTSGTTYSSSWIRRYCIWQPGSRLRQVGHVYESVILAGVLEILFWSWIRSRRQQYSSQLHRYSACNSNCSFVYFGIEGVKLGYVNWVVQRIWLIPLLLVIHTCLYLHSHTHTLNTVVESTQPSNQRPQNNTLTRESFPCKQQGRKLEAMLWFRKFVAGLSSQRPRVDSRPSHVYLWWTKWQWGKFFSKYSHQCSILIHSSIEGAT